MSSLNRKIANMRQLNVAELSHVAGGDESGWYTTSQVCNHYVENGYSIVFCGTTYDDYNSD